MVLSQEALAVLRMLVLYMSRRWACLSGTAAQRQGSHDAPQQEDGVPSGNSRHSRLSLWADMWTLAVNCFTFLGRNGIVLFTLVRHVNCELFHFSPFFVFTALLGPIQLDCRRRRCWRQGLCPSADGMVFPHLIWQVQCRRIFALPQ